MKSLTIILLLVCIKSMDQIVGAYPWEDNDYDHDHHHHHHHPRYAPTHMQLTTCAAKLDFLCLSRINDQIEAYKDSVDTIIDDLTTRIDTRLELYDTAKEALQRQWLLLVNSNTLTLLKLISAKAAPLNPNNAAQNVTLTCLNSIRVEIINKFYTENLFAVRSCISNNNLNSTTAQSIANLTTNAATATSRICDCVSNVNTGSSKTEKSSAKGCAEAAASNLNTATIQQQANTIYNQVDTAATTSITSLNTCLTNIPMTTQMATITQAIANC